ncbi:M20/M25/M40 family metallo-hydrolase [Fulvivirgaceae bacterium PWU4]|uniref:Carboxypeptidase Q n=1 Tax=Chryseosolibacter histidini TaxID=2782349 RepID=A0AAP2GP30_9BACT|nr:M20/M25/M40 family metallo-hydrolase [Chryseosolibacter histidini]MBT1698648.1 M20/M25/M40 family metallo-hydrolase [Chryseosolibacter histidini]
MKKFLRLLFTAFSFLLPAALMAQQQEKLDTAMISRIKKEGFDNSQVMNILSMLTDVHGPRLTNSPGYRKAADYAKATLESWGVQNVHFDTWNEEFGTGWELKKFSLQTLSPVYFPVIAYPKAWTPGIKGPVQAEAVYLDIKKEEDLAKYKGKLKGKIVLFSLPTPVKPGFVPDATRLVDSVLLQMANSGPTEAFTGRRFQGAQEPQRLAYLKWDLLQKEGAIAVLEASPASRLEDGTLTVAAATVPYPAEVPNEKRARAYSANVPKILPQVVVAAEHYNRMVRQLQNGQAVKLELTLETAFTPAAPGFNVIGEIPGTDLKDEVVMIGAHLDSWHSGTGTTDNAAGSCVMLEAMRILKSLGASPRRTIRIALWGGEEQGLLGSRNYVKRTFGSRLDKSYPYDSLRLTPAAEKFSVYFNMDNGTGKYRGVYMQGNEAARTPLRLWLKPFEKLGASTLTLRNTSGTDHLSFDALGLPAFQFIQDPIEYGTRTHHTSMDLFDKAVEPDLKHNAVMTAAFAWQAANREEKFPRK